MKDEVIINLATAIWRSGYIKDKNKVRQKAKEDMRRLVAYNIAGELKGVIPDFKVNIFLEACKLEGRYEAI